MALTDKLTAIADAIRSKTGKTDAFTLAQMPGEIEGIQTGGGSVGTRLPACKVSVEWGESVPFDNIEVQTVSGAGYDFALSDGYWVSQNKGVNRSAAVCKLAFWAREATTLTLNCINYAESKYDFGLISNIDTMLKLDNTEDSSGVFKSFKGESSPDVVRVDIPVSAGNHYLCIKYRKDSNGADGDDTFKFAIAE